MSYLEPRRLCIYPMEGQERYHEVEALSCLSGPDADNASDPTLRLCLLSSFNTLLPTLQSLGLGT